MRKYFDEQLFKLTEEFMEMKSLVEKSIIKSTDALEKRDYKMAETVIKEDAIINDKEKEIESVCLKLILNQQPVANDLRQISTMLKMITDMERVGDHSADISQICIILSKQPYNKNLDNIIAMSRLTTKMFKESIESFINKDLELANSVIKCDEQVNKMFENEKKDIIKLIHEDENNGEQAIEFLQIAKYFERIGDHSKNLAEWAIFSLTGVHKDTQVLL